MSEGITSADIVEAAKALGTEEFSRGDLAAPARRREAGHQARLQGSAPPGQAREGPRRRGKHRLLPPHRQLGRSSRRPPWCRASRTGRRLAPRAPGRGRTRATPDTSARRGTRGRRSRREVGRVGQPDLERDRPGGVLLAKDLEGAGGGRRAGSAGGDVDRALDPAVGDQQGDAPVAVDLDPT